MNSLTQTIAVTRRRIDNARRGILLKKIVWPLLSPLYIDRSPDYRRSIFIAGTERSGTTWVSDIVNYNREYRYVFEPFWAAQVEMCKGFREQQYLRPGNQDPYFVATVEAILSGRVRNRWTDKYHRRFIASKRLIKDVRSNLFLKWMHDQFPEVPIVLLLRHPCAVASSQRKRKNWPPDPKEEFLAQQELVEDLLYPFRGEIEAAQTDFERMIFRWCIQNYVPLKQFGTGEIEVVFYENLCEKPRSEVAKVFSFLGKDYDEAVLTTVRKPSPQSHTVSAVISGGSLIDSWREKVTVEETNRAIEILSLFGLDKIYSQDSMPDETGLRAVMDGR